MPFPIIPVLYDSQSACAEVKLVLLISGYGSGRPGVTAPQAPAGATLLRPFFKSQIEPNRGRIESRLEQGNKLSGRARELPGKKATTLPGPLGGGQD